MQATEHETTRARYYRLNARPACTLNSKQRKERQRLRRELARRAGR